MVVSIVVLDFACGSSGCVLWLCVVFVVVCCVVVVVVCLWSGREHWAWMVVVEVRQGVDGPG